MAVTIFKVFHERLTKIPVALPEMTSALFWTSAPTKQVIVSVVMTNHVFYLLSVLYWAVFHKVSPIPTKTWNIVRS